MTPADSWKQVKKYREDAGERALAGDTVGAAALDTAARQMAERLKAAGVAAPLPEEPGR